MKSQGKPTKSGMPVRRTNKTKEHFLHWRRKQEALKRQTAVSDKDKAAAPPTEELMTWADDGGSVKSVKDDGSSVKKEV